MKDRGTDRVLCSCGKIIKGGAPSSGETHGCPFRHYSAGNLEATLYKDNISTNHVNEIMTLIQGSHYQLACTKYFEVTHPDHDKIDVIEHPNAYYELSLGDSDDKKKTDGEAMEVER
jgi:DNA primase large subunit